MEEEGRKRKREEGGGVLILPTFERLVIILITRVNMKNTSRSGLLGSKDESGFASRLRGDARCSALGRLQGNGKI